MGSPSSGGIGANRVPPEEVAKLTATAAATDGSCCSMRPVGRLGRLVPIDPRPGELDDEALGLGLGVEALIRHR
jgi:hypothetical protein